MTMHPGNFEYNENKQRVLFGTGVIKNLQTEISRSGYTAPFLLTTPQQAAMAQQVSELLAGQVAGSFTRATMHTPLNVTMDALECVNATKADCLLSIGGGSTIGLGKAMSLRSRLPHICIVTTYAGSEMTPIVGETEDQRKVTRVDPDAIPSVVIYDVDLTLSLPTRMSATSGLNAMAHAIEALYARDTNLIVNTFALAGIRSLASSILQVLENPRDISFRSQALLGAWFCGKCLATAIVALHHKLCHVLGGSFNLPHAETHTILLPHALAYTAPSIPQVMTDLAASIPNSEGDAGEFQLSSPCSHLELPETLTEPILLRYAAQHGFPCRFRTQFVSYNDSIKDNIIVTIKDTIFDKTYTITTKYLLGADGAKSPIARQLGLPMAIQPSQGIALNVLVNADLTNLMKNRVGNLHYVIRPDVEQPDFAWWSIVRMVKPWHEWLVIMMYKPTCPVDFMPNLDQITAQVREVIGDPAISPNIKRVDKWVINETVAETYSKNNIANNSLREHKPIFDALGLLKPSLQERKQELLDLEDNSAVGRMRRRKLMEAIDYKSHEFLALGSDMNQRYKSAAVYLEASGAEPPLPTNPTLHHEPHTFPGHRLPHAWLNTAIPQKQVSTLDLAGKGRSSLFLGHGGEAWRNAARQLEQSMNIAVAIFEIGYGLEYEAVFNTWYKLREVEEDGCILVRPDNFIAWRSQRLAADPTQELMTVFQSILAW
ncbi:hypothetical protein H9Q70_001256 [Fusarium xylarioides]|nr:hypothetical protein H9Q70_001256 [Fusarium xylarioides]